MTEMVKTENYSTSVSRRNANRENSAVLADELEDQKEKLQPVIDFYDKLVKGWHFRILRAERAMADPKNKSDSQQKIFLELRNAAKVELDKYLPVYREMQEMQEMLDQRIKELEMMQFKNSLPKSGSSPAVIDFKEARELMYKADALIELRTQE